MVEGSLLRLRSSNKINPAHNPITSPNHDENLRRGTCSGHSREDTGKALLSDPIESYPLYADEI